MQADGIQGLHAVSSEFSCELGHSLWWLFDTCDTKGQIPFTFNDNLYSASKDLFELGKKYESFVFAYTCSNRGWIKLEVKGSTIQPTGDFFAGMEYEAYNILIDWHESEEPLSLINFENCPLDLIQRSLKINGIDLVIN